MMNRRIVVQSSVDTIFSVLCDGMDKVIIFKREQIAARASTSLKSCFVLDTSFSFTI